MDKQSDVWVVTHYAGQLIEPENIEGSKGVFGSELALLEVFKRVSFKVTVFISKPSGYHFEKYGITWKSDEDWNHLIKNPPKHIVISRYIGSMCDYYMPTSCKIWLWVHDTIPHPAYQGIQLTPSFCRNMSKRLSGIVTVGDSQKDEIIIPNFKLNKELFTTIKNGITLIKDFKLNKERCPMSFVYASGPDRGLWDLLKMWPAILNKWHWATLQIFHGLSDEEIKRINDMRLPRVYPMGRATQTELFKKLQVIDYWLYPCTFFETCCTTAIEMQYFGPICISTKLGALKENNKGLLIDNETFQNDVMDHLEYLEQHPEQKTIIRERQHEWAKQQSWDARAQQWNELLQK
jgi:hypothetical protein